MSVPFRPCLFFCRCQYRSDRVSSSADVSTVLTVSLLLPMSVPFRPCLFFCRCHDRSDRVSSSADVMTVQTVSLLLPSLPRHGYHRRTSLPRCVNGCMTTASTAVSCRKCLPRRPKKRQSYSAGRGARRRMIPVLTTTTDRRPPSLTCRSGRNISSLVPVSVTSVSESCCQTPKDKLRVALFSGQSVGSTSVLKRTETVELATDNDIDLPLMTAAEMIDILAVFSFSQSVVQPTHVRGHSLDRVTCRSEVDGILH